LNNIERYENASLLSSEIVTKSFSTSFSLGILCLGKEVRKPIYGIYGFVRVADEIVDTFFGVDQQRALDDFELATYQAIKDRYSSNIILHALVPIDPVAPNIDTFFKKTPKKKKVYKNIE